MARKMWWSSVPVPVLLPTPVPSPSSWAKATAHSSRRCVTRRTQPGFGAGVRFQRRPQSGSGNCQLGSGDVSILLGRGDGTFAAAVNYPAAAGASSLAVGDFNGDGRADLVAGGGKNLSMLLGNGDGMFRAASNLPQSISPTGLAPGDFKPRPRHHQVVAGISRATSSMPSLLPRLREYFFSAALFQCSWTPRLESRVPAPSGS